MTKEKKSSAKIIKGPWRRTINTPTEDQIVKAEQLAYCDEISHICLMSILSILVENGIDTGEKSFIKNITFITETIKASIFKTNDISHPLQILMDMTTDISTDSDNSINCKLNDTVIISMIEKQRGKALMEDDDDIS